jgi:hypothetical protein
MTSPRAREARPIRSVVLRVKLSADAATCSSLKERYPSARVKGGTFELTVEGEEPPEVAEKARELLNRFKVASVPPKDFK